MLKRFCLTLGLGLMLIAVVACATPTPTPTPSLTPKPTDTPTPVPTATATPIPTNTPTPTVTPTRTNTPRPTLTPTPSTETYSLFIDNYDATCNLLTDDTADATRKCEGGEYIILNKVANKNWSALYRDSFDDVIIEFDARVVSGSGNIEYGMWFRASTDSKAYLLSIYPQGGYGLAAMVGNDWQDLLAPGPSDAVKKGNEKNHIKIVAQGDQIALFVNGQFLDSLSDKISSAGRIGFFMWSQEPNVKVAFDNLSVSKINKPQPIPEARPKTPTPTPLPTLPAGMGGLIVYNWLGAELNYTVGGKLYKIPPNSHVIIVLAPGKYTFSLDAPGLKAACSTAEGCTVTIQAGRYETQSWSLQR